MSTYTVGRKFPFWLLFTFFVVGSFVLFAGATSMFKNRILTIPPNLHADLISQRFTNIPECFAFQDESTGRVYPGILDLNKFNQDQLNRCYITDEERGIKEFNFRLKLKDTEITTNKYFSHDKDKLTLFKEVLIKDADSLQKDQLIIYVQERIGS
jgi:hypothetical protein